MQRDLSQLGDREFDLIVVGGGITGAFTAWDAAQRGLRVALIERGDFGHATSAASSKVIHGGIRHMQQGDVRRVRESLVERRIFRHIAPHLVYPIPFLVPTYGHGMRGKQILSLGMLVYETLGFDQNRIDDRARHLPRFQTLSRKKALELEPDLPTDGLTGAVRYWECHMHNSERMTLAVIKSAVREGAVVANYVEAREFAGDASRVTGVRARDLLTGDDFDLRAALVANVSGPWARRVLDRVPGQEPSYQVGLSKGVHLITRSLTQSGAVALATKHRNEAVVNRGGRHFFVIPWRGLSLIGTTNVPYSGDPADVQPTETDVADFISEINDAMPAASLERSDVRHAFAGLYPLINKDIKPGVYQGAGQYQVYDHAKIDDLEGMVTVIGAKYTTARSLARQTVDLTFRKLSKRSPSVRTGCTPVVGGDIGPFERFVERLKREEAHGLDQETTLDLAMSYGSEYRRVLKWIDQDASLGTRIAGDRPAIAASVLHAVREEMAMRLGDVVFRRTGLGTIGHPGRKALERCARIMATELGWSEADLKTEIEAVDRSFEIAPADDNGSGEEADPERRAEAGGRA